MLTSTGEAGGCKFSRWDMLAATLLLALPNCAMSPSEHGVISSDGDRLGLSCASRTAAPQGFAIGSPAQQTSVTPETVDRIEVPHLAAFSAATSCPNWSYLEHMSCPSIVANA